MSAVLAHLRERSVIAPSVGARPWAGRQAGAFTRENFSPVGMESRLLGRCVRTIHARMACGLSLARFDALAENAGWTLSQRRTDAHGRHALHVLERAG